MRPDIAVEPLVSVILPVFNGGDFLLPAVLSIINQTYKNWELIILDDGSTDNAIDQVSRLTDPRVKVFCDGTNKGLANRLNELISLTSGTYIARMDADDIAFPSRLSEQVNYLEKHPTIDLVGCRAVVFKKNGITIGMLPFATDHEELCAKPWRNIPIPHPTWMARNLWFKSHLYLIPEVLRAEDQELLLRSYVSSKFACLDQVFLGYRQGPFNLRRTLTARRTLLSAQMRIFKERREWRNLSFAITLTIIKIFVDLVVAIPGLQSLYFRRMGEPVPVDVQKELECLLNGKVKPT